MECVHKVLAYLHLEDFFFLPFPKSEAFVYERLIESNKPQGCCFSQTALLRRSVMQTIRFSPMRELHWHVEMGLLSEMGPSRCFTATVGF